ncbi:hypothetical protein [Aeoliella sp. SH292]|uniref:hypothetical protein n=1 Tax=Aeoliella sp. SH292 TaxID=3454464 RepID=UPI003F968C7F
MVGIEVELRQLLSIGSTIAILILATSSLAGNIDVSLRAIPTPNLRGFTTLTIHVASDAGAVNGVDASFEGTLNQINPFLLPTIFQDHNSVLTAAGGYVIMDSQFLFYSDKVGSFDTAESGTFLRGALTNLAPFDKGAGFDLAQLVIRNETSLHYHLAIDDGSREPTMVTGIITPPDLSLRGTSNGGRYLSKAL